MLAVALLALTSAGAQDTTAPEDPVARQVSCRLTLSIDMSMQDRWFHSPGETGVGLAEAESVARGQPFAVYVFFRNWTPHRTGEIGLDYDLRITKPSGALYKSEEKLEGHSGIPGDEDLLMADQVLRLAFDATDALGAYVFTVTARDRASGTKDTAKQTIELVDYVPGPGFDDRASFDAWFQQYFRAPQPERLVPAIVDLGRLGAWKEMSGNAQTVAFLQEAMAGNAWLFPRLLERFHELDADTKRLILHLVSRSSFDAQAFTAALKGRDAEAWTAVSQEPRRDPLYDAIGEPAHVDQLWGMFLAGGRFAPVLRLCEALVPEHTEAVAGGPQRAALKTAVAKSLRDKAREHKLVRSYCDWIRSGDTVPEEVRLAVDATIRGR